MQTRGKVIKHPKLHENLALSEGSPTDLVGLVTALSHEPHIDAQVYAALLEALPPPVHELTRAWIGLQLSIDLLPHVLLQYWEKTGSDPGDFTRAREEREGKMPRHSGTENPARLKAALFQQIHQAIAETIYEFDEIGNRLASLLNVKQLLRQAADLGESLKDEHYSGAMALLHDVVVFNRPFDTPAQLQFLGSCLRSIQERPVFSRDDNIRLHRMLRQEGLDTTPSLSPPTGEADE